MRNAVAALMCGLLFGLVAASCSGSDREFGSGNMGGSSVAGAAGEGGTAGQGTSGSAASAGAQAVSGAGGDDPSGMGGTGLGGMGGEGPSGTGGVDPSGAGGDGMSGAGGTPDTPGAPLGTSCTDSNECASGHCVDDVCCDSACEGPCRACSTSGACNLTPADDEACPNVDCPTSTPCRTYSPDITSNRCAELGKCKTESACTFENVAARTKCGASDGNTLCDGAGNCNAPTVPCGSTASCSLSGTLTCCAITSTTLSCRASSTCGYTSGMQLVNHTRLCMDQSDCPLSQYCCAGGSGSQGAASSWLRCETSAKCTGERACNPSSVPSECPAGQTCTLAGTGWRSGIWFCE